MAAASVVATDFSSEVSVVYYPYCSFGTKVVSEFFPWLMHMLCIRRIRLSKQLLYRFWPLIYHFVIFR